MSCPNLLRELACVPDQSTSAYSSLRWHGLGQERQVDLFYCNSLKALLCQTSRAYSGQGHMKNSVSIYFVKTELEALAAEMVAGQLGLGASNLLVYSGAKAPYLINPDAFDNILEFSYEKEKGFLKEKRGIYNNLKKLGTEVGRLRPRPENIYIHLPRLSTSKTNYAINYLIKKFPQSIVRVRLIPHGIVSSSLISITPARRLKLLRRKFHFSSIFFPALKYYPPTHDLIGGLDQIVDRVYTFQGLSTPFPAHKVVELSGLRNYVQSTPKARSERSAIIIGQPLLENDLISEENHDIVTKQIRDWLTANSFQTIYYSKHPRSKDRLDFFQNEYKLLEQDGAVEIALCEIQPDVVISCYSTALATAKVLFGNQIQAISFGLMLSQSDKKEGLSRFFSSINIEIH